MTSVVFDVISAVQTKCTIKERKYFNTHRSSQDADKLAKYIYYLPYNEHIILLTLGEAFTNMTSSALEALSSVGVDITDVVNQGQILTAFIVIGSHCRTMYELYEQDPACLHIQLNGTSFINFYSFKQLSLLVVLRSQDASQ